MFRTVNKVKCLNERRCYVLADVISIFVYEVPCIFWRYINVDEVSLITLKKLLQSAMELLQIATVQVLLQADVYERLKTSGKAMKITLLRLPNINKEK